MENLTKYYKGVIEIVCIILGNMYCGVHVSSEGKLPLNQYVNNIAIILKYEHPAIVVSIAKQLLMATHYVELSSYGEELQPKYYIKMTFKSIALIKEKPIFGKTKEFLGEYGIPYDINEIKKRNNDIIENNPV
ncbi:hypothetical protein H8356DRAFT_1707225, partial [Neocallimastix lanati (nom. inval.)]